MKAYSLRWSEALRAKPQDLSTTVPARETATAQCSRLCRLLRRLASLFQTSWGCARRASLHPRLYAVACFAGFCASPERGNDLTLKLGVTAVQSERGPVVRTAITVFRILKHLALCFSEGFGSTSLCTFAMKTHHQFLSRLRINRP